MANGHHHLPSSSPSRPSPLKLSDDSSDADRLSSSSAPPEEDAEEAIPPIDFSLASVADESAPILSSITALSSSLSSVYSEYQRLHSGRLASYHTQLRVSREQQRSLQASIDELRAALSVMAEKKSSKQTALSSLRTSVSSAQSQSAELQTAVSESTLRLSHLRARTAKRHSHRQRPARLTLSTFLVWRGARGGPLRRVMLPLVAADRIFTFLPVRDVDSCMRTCRLWQQVIHRSRVWPLSFVRVLRNKKKKERELEDGGEQLTKDEFDDWQTAHALDGVDSTAALTSADHFGVHDDLDTKPPKPAPEDDFVLSKAAAAALNLPPHDLPVPEHLHYALTVDIQKEQYVVSITSRRVHTLYACASLMDTLHPNPSAPAPALPKSSSVTICCPLVPKSTNAAELAFCQSAIALSEQIEVAKKDVERLGLQLEEDAAVKRRLQAELEEREEEVRRVQSELDMSTQQSMSDEMTRQFLDDNVREVQGQVDEEEQQTRSLRDMLRDAYRRREDEVAAMEREAEGMEREVVALREEKGRLTREVKGLQLDLEGIAGDKERAKREYEKLMDLVEQLRASAE